MLYFVSHSGKFKILFPLSNLFTYSENMHVNITHSYSYLCGNDTFFRTCRSLKSWETTKIRSEISGENLHFTGTYDNDWIFR